VNEDELFVNLPVNSRILCDISCLSLPAIISKIEMGIKSQNPSNKPVPLGQESATEGRGLMIFVLGGGFWHETAEPVK